MQNGAHSLKKLADIMGILREDAESFLAAGKNKMISKSGLDVSAIETLIAERNQCRSAKNWARSDEIRDLLQAQDIELKDGPTGTTWSVKNN